MNRVCGCIRTSASLQPLNGDIWAGYLMQDDVERCHHPPIICIFRDLKKKNITRLLILKRESLRCWYFQLLKKQKRWLRRIINWWCNCARPEPKIVWDAPKCSRKMLGWVVKARSLACWWRVMICENSMENDVYWVVAGDTKWRSE